jgi:hypothetical protein
MRRLLPDRMNVEMHPAPASGAGRVFLMNFFATIQQGSHAMPCPASSVADRLQIIHIER